MTALTAPHVLDGARWRGQRVGLLGGSFNPPHAGHLHISLNALNLLKLDCIWWLVTPQNPLKSASDLYPFTKRFDLCRRLTNGHPRLIVSNLESMIGTTRTFDTLTILRARFPVTDFVFITGMDNALTFHTWHRWQDILGLAATAHIARPPALDQVRNCPLRAYSRQNHVTLDQPVKAPLAPGFSYWMRQGQLLDISSTMLRTL